MRIVPFVSERLTVVGSTMATSARLMALLSITQSTAMRTRSSIWSWLKERHRDPGSRHSLQVWGIKTFPPLEFKLLELTTSCSSRQESLVKSNGRKIRNTSLFTTARETNVEHTIHCSQPLTYRYTSSHISTIHSTPPSSPLHLPKPSRNPNQQPTLQVPNLRAQLLKPVSARIP